MADNGEILNDAEVEFLLTAAGDDDASTPTATGPGTDGQTVTMRGDLEQINLADIFQTLAMSKMEGVLRVSNPLEERQIYCHDGRVRIQVPPRIATRRLGQRLVQAGLLQADQLRQVLVAQRKEKVPIGLMLVQAGVLTQDQIDEIVGMQVSEDLFALFTWRHGSFEFFKGPLTSDVQRATFEACPEFEVSSLLLEVARRSDEWQSILEALGSLDEIPHRIADPTADSDGNEAHRALLAGTDGQATYRDLTEQTTLGLFEVARAARDLVRGGLLANIDDPAMVAVAAQFAEAGNAKKAVLLLQTLRDRPGDRPLEVLRGMAQALEKAGERRLAGNLLLEAAQRQGDAETALQLARNARDLSPYDPGTLSFLRTILLAHAPADSPELEKCTIELLDALIDGDLVPTALEIVADARLTGTLRPQILMREARARQKARDPQGAAAVLFELGQAYDELGDRPRAIEAYEALLRLDRSRKDVQKLISLRRQTRLGRIVRLATAAAATLMLGGMGVVLWQQHSVSQAVAEADRDISALLSSGDRAGARERWQHWSDRLGDNEAIEDLRNRIAFAEAAEQGRLQKILRARINERLTQAAQQLGRGELGAALQVYSEIWTEGAVRDEVTDVVATRFDALLADLELVTKGLPHRLPPEPNTLFDRKALLTNLADLQSACTPAQLRTFSELQDLVTRRALPEFLSADRQARVQALVSSGAPSFRRAQDLTQAYTEALQRNDQQRRLDPMFKAAVEHEGAFEFAAALELYRELERQPAGDKDLRAHFRDHVARNATIVKLLDAVRTATASGDFTTAQQQLRALRRSFPEVPFDRLVQLPLQVDSQPRGARVRCNGVDAGVTPLLLERAPADETRVEVQLDGFRGALTTVRGDETGTWTGHLLLIPDRTWKHGSQIEVPPAFTEAGDLVLVDRGGNVAAVDPAKGEARWTFRSGDLSGLLTQPVLDGGLVVVGSLDGDLRALRLGDGGLAWSIPGLPTEAAPIRIDRTLILATTDRRLCSVNLQTREVSSVPLPEFVHGHVLVQGSTVVAIGERGSILAFSLPGLRPLWTQSVGSNSAPMAALPRGCVIVAEEQGQLNAFDLADGQRKWRQDLRGELLGIVATDDRTVVVASAVALHRLDAATGNKAETITRPECEWAPGLAVVGDRLLAPLRDGSIQVVNLASGEPLYRLDASKRSRPLPVNGGLLLQGNDQTVQWFARLR